MPTVQLPLAQPIRLSSRASWLAWNQAPTRQPLEDKIEFWTAMTALTVPQELALRLGRTPDLVSIGTIRQTFDRRRKRLCDEEWTFASLTRYRTIWRRTHRATLFRVEPERVKRKLAADNPLAPLMAWAEPEDVFEDRYLMAGYDQGWGRPRRLRHVYKTLHNATALGFVTDVREVSVPARLWMPHDRWCRTYSVRSPRLKHTALDHGALAVEAGLMRQGLRDTTAAIRGLRPEADLAAAMRRKAGRKVVVGTRYDALPDLEIVTRGDQRYAIEVLSENYRNDDLLAKYADIQRSVEYVATSRTVAQRVLRVNPNATCFHF
jgi:hypothetical protein